SDHRGPFDNSAVARHYHPPGLAGVHGYPQYGPRRAVLPRPFDPVSQKPTPESRGYLPQHMVPDAAGYFVLYVDHVRGMLSLEHYRKEGALDTIIEGREAAEIYISAIDHHLVS